MYYAILHAYGVGTLNKDGGRPNYVCAFYSKAARDEWLEEGPFYLWSADARTAADSSDPRVRAARRSPWHHWQQVRLNDQGDSYKTLPFLEI